MNELHVAPSRRPDEQHMVQRRQASLHALLDTLPEVQGETLALRVVLGLSLLETAEATGVPVNTVRSRVRLAREALRARIEAEPA
ncbi:MAG TPA: sigma factor-like helix-turn-helix DNA-binding protein [Polyangiales bacterium]|nr:sigma factor-like helix-turn-helix DNA-binding protein [Polyangiales bacterium]